MDAKEWLTCQDPDEMLEFLGKTASKRKLRLIACARCRKLWHLLTHEWSKNAVEAGERFADGQASDQERVETFEAARNAAAEMIPAERVRAVLYQGQSPDSPAAGAALAAAAAAYHDDALRLAELETLQHAVRILAGYGARAAELWVQTALLRDVFGNPFRPVAFDPGWLTPVVLALATSAYDNRILPAGTLEADRLAVLADALEDAGCDNTDLLEHPRSNGPHLRGCWAVDAILNRS